MWNNQLKQVLFSNFIENHQLQTYDNWLNVFELVFSELYK